MLNNGSLEWVTVNNFGRFLIGYQNSPDWNRAYQQIPLAVREDLEFVSDPHVTAFLISSAGVYKTNCWSSVEEGTKFLLNNPDLLKALEELLLERYQERQETFNAICADLQEYFRWELNYAEIPERLRDKKFKKGVNSGFSINDLKPELTKFEEEIYNTFFLLHTSRSSSEAGPNRISLQNIKLLVDEGLTTVSFDVLMTVARYLDTEYLIWWQNKRSAAANKS